MGILSRAIEAEGPLGMRGKGGWDHAFNSLTCSQASQGVIEPIPFPLQPMDRVRLISTKFAKPIDEWPANA